jgi:hypothetical protein
VTAAAAAAAAAAVTAATAAAADACISRAVSRALCVAQQHCQQLPPGPQLALPTAEAARRLCLLLLLLQLLVPAAAACISRAASRGCVFHCSIVCSGHSLPCRLQGQPGTSVCLLGAQLRCGRLHVLAAATCCCCHLSASRSVAFVLSGEWRVHAVSLRVMLLKAEHTYTAGQSLSVRRITCGSGRQQRGARRKPACQHENGCH